MAPGLSIAGALALAGIGAWMAGLAARGSVLVAWRNELRVDALSAQIGRAHV